MGRYNGDSFGTVANTSHCKSPADSREPRRVLCVRHSLFRRLSRGSMVLHKQPTPLLTHLSPLKPHNQSHSLKIKNSGVLIAPLELFNSGSGHHHRQCWPATRLILKTLSVYMATARVRSIPRSLKHGGNKRLILKNVLQSSVPVCSSWATPCIN